MRVNIIISIILYSISPKIAIKSPFILPNVSSDSGESTCHIKSDHSCDFPTDKMTNVTTYDTLVSVKEEIKEQEWLSSSSFTQAAVSVDARECASIGSQVMKEKGGNCIDSVLSVLFCMGLVIPESMGLGGGFLMTFFNATSKKGFTIDARDVAPAYAHDGMFAEGEQINARIGIRSIAIPGELAGYERAHQLFASLPWRELIEPSVHLARTGFKVGNHLSDSIAVKWNEIKQLGPPGAPLLATLTNPATNLPYREGDTMKREDLAHTFQIISREGAHSMHSKNGSIIQQLIHDLNRLNSSIDIEDFINYQVKVTESPVSSLVNGFKIYSPSTPGSGEVLSFIVDVTLRMYESSNFTISRAQHEEQLFWFRLIEVWKFAFAQRSYLGDPDFEDSEETAKSIKRLKSATFRQAVAQKILSMRSTVSDDKFYRYDDSSSGDVVITEDHGTAAVTVIDAHGNAVSVGTTVNQYFGSYILSPSTGIILNDAMDDFASSFMNQFNVTPSTYNRIHPGKRPMSSMAPAVVTVSSKDNEEKVFMSIGGSGGTQITTSTSLVILRCILFNDDLTTAIESARVHHQLQPNLLKYEESVNESLLEFLRDFNHTTSIITGRSSIIMALKRSLHTQQIHACSDSRKGGAVDGW